MEANQVKIPVYGFVSHPDGTRERKLAAYVLRTPSGYPVLEVKSGKQFVWIDLPVLINQLTTTDTQL